MKNNRSNGGVALRTKPLKNGSQTLYLDYYINGVRHKDYLGMYIVPETSRLDRLRNRETMNTAETLRVKKALERQAEVAGLAPASDPDEGDRIHLLDYLSAQAEHYRDIGSRQYSNTIVKLSNWIRLFGRDILLYDVDREYLTEFFTFIRNGTGRKRKKTGRPGRAMFTDTGVSEGTAYQFYQVIGTLFNNAIRDGIAQRNPTRLLSVSERPKKPESEREYLTYDEVRKLISTPTKDDRVKRAFLFSCFTGLRISDVERLTWSAIKDTQFGKEISVIQTKTGTTVKVPISDNAYQFLPARRGRAGDTVFKLPDRTAINTEIHNWTRAAGIAKHITFHCARHTYATLLLTYGADLYTVSKLLGHSDIGVTQVYAKVIDSKRREAAELIPDIK